MNDIPAAYVLFVSYACKVDEDAYLCMYRCMYVGVRHPCERVRMTRVMMAIPVFRDSHHLKYSLWSYVDKIDWSGNVCR